MKLIIGNKNYSSWSLRAWLAAREGGFTFEEIRIPLFIPGSRERILSHSPSGKVPCLNDHGVVVWDSLAIGEYLAEKRPGQWQQTIEYTLEIEGEDKPACIAESVVRQYFKPALGTEGRAS